MKVKICGITNTADALKAASLGAWAVGFIFFKKSPRYVGPFKAQKIIASLPPFVTPVGVFVDQKEGAVRDIIKFCGINTLQFHGAETPEYCRRFDACKIIKAFRVGEGFELEQLKKFQVSAFLFDAYQENAYGGTGKTFNWQIIKDAKNYGRPIILSGGLNPANVKEAAEIIKPYAVDVSSGVEQKPGEKSEQLLKEFFTSVTLL